jgi:hypothetical protein
VGSSVPRFVNGPHVKQAVNQGRRTRIPRSCSNTTLPVRSERLIGVPSHSPICKVLETPAVDSRRRRRCECRLDAPLNVPSSDALRSTESAGRPVSGGRSEGRKPLSASKNALKIQDDKSCRTEATSTVRCLPSFRSLTYSS